MSSSPGPPPPPKRDELLIPVIIVASVFAAFVTAATARTGFSIATLIGAGVCFFFLGAIGAMGSSSLAGGDSEGARIGWAIATIAIFMGIFVVSSAR